VALEGAKADDVAKEMGISRNAVIIAKCRVLNRLRQEAEGLIESSSGLFAKS
jgi:RNA polymerase sigma-70 factor (ECF subfamily)